MVSSPGSGGAGDGTELGVPMYVAGRIGLFSRLPANGWDLAELREAAEWEEWMVDDCLTAMELPYDDDDASVVARQVGFWVKQPDDEAIGRRPREEWPESWYRESSGGTPASLSDQELAETRARLARFLAKVERTDLATASEAWRQACFTTWGGVTRELLFDQMKSVLTRDDQLTGGGLTHNPEFLRFCRHYDVMARRCRPYRAKTKGKVERPIRYLRESFLYGRTFLGDADLHAQAEHWLATVANERVHGTTKAVPAERFAAEERTALQPLPARPYRSLVLDGVPVPTPRPTAAPMLPQVPQVPHVAVERRSLAAYAALAGSER